jgi:hypothetical protein
MNNFSRQDVLHLFQFIRIFFSERFRKQIRVFLDKKIPVGIDFLELNEAYPYVAQIFQRDVCRLVFFGLFMFMSLYIRFEPIISNVLKDFSITLCNDETKTKVENAKLENRNFVFTIKKYPSLLKLRDLPSSQIGFFFFFVC